MNLIRKSPIQALGYGFISGSQLPAGQDEYYLRNRQNKSGIQYRHLTAYEIEVLVRNRNQSDDWNKLLVSDAFNPELVKNCKFFGLVRIGKLEPYCLEFNNLRMPVGLYNSTVISCDFGDNVVVDNVNYLAHYIIGNEVMLVNINELATTNHAKFGNGILKEDEEEKVRIWLELCNENGGRSILPFDGMLPGDAYLWSRNRQDSKLQEKFIEFTTNRFDQLRGYYGMIGDRTVVKNCSILKDVRIGSDAYIKGANKIKNVTIRSTPEARTQVGEGCELVNGIIGIGCRIFYGVKAVRFVMASHSQLKYGARLINSYLGNNATISCCEVLNSLIFPAHEQHHNNSFLCAALVMGQSNMAAGATIGSNHNSRSADGELIAGRGFWPGLCVSLKHNSRFASFCILAKGDYPAELNIQFPFALVSNSLSNERLQVMPAYWFQYNMYALARNSWKYVDRDSRIDKTQLIEFDYLAPDTAQEMAAAIALLEVATGKAWFLREGRQFSEKQAREKGRVLLVEGDDAIAGLDILVDNAENSQRPVQIIKAAMGYQWYRRLLTEYAAREIVAFHERKGGKLDKNIKALPAVEKPGAWENIGGQLLQAVQVKYCLQAIKKGTINSWDDVHQFYRQEADSYPDRKLAHAISLYQQVFRESLSANNKLVKQLLKDSVGFHHELSARIRETRQKDYQNPFRQMVYQNEAEMDAVVGKLENNSFILSEQQAAKRYARKITALLQ
ncbi:DUF4954 family protein [Flavihumibacter petaseus]|uniref:DUF4954 domain-containing protein n=1 Tax=Flavihumibacter petaseus NBRC 106054 TaxID=1220578 RepID=A0A0E9N8K4_9BACT|nr:DUF4954 family protein [Flavihumibacter petaseus]GAO45725.1 hypothetical protein FPE01S_08_00450 [Flavihumibacter petaseus NBRC 106054]